MARAEIIRALVEFMIRSNIDFAQFANAEDMVSYLRSGQPRGLRSSLSITGGAYQYQ